MTTALRRLAAVSIVAAMAWTGGVAAQAQELRKTSFAPTTLEISTGHAAHSSIPSAMGYWKEEGLDVNVYGVNGSTAGIQQVAAGNLDFATVGGEALIVARARGLQLKAVYMYARGSIYRIVTPVGLNLTSIAALKGKTIGVPSMTDGQIPYTRAALLNAGLHPDNDVKWLATGTGAPAAVAIQRGDVQAWASWDTAVAALENRGLEFNLLQPPYFDELFGNVIISREDFIKQNPDLVVKIARGIARSTVFGFANPEAAIRNHWRIYPQTKPQGTDEAKLLAESLRVYRSRFDGFKLNAGVTKWGLSTKEQWDRLLKIALEQKLVPENFDINAAYTNEFVDEINKFDAEKVTAQAKSSGW
jgi:NitT/TauT family transport system substrate-binding protein